MNASLHEDIKGITEQVNGAFAVVRLILLFAKKLLRIVTPAYSACYTCVMYSGDHLRTLGLFSLIPQPICFISKYLKVRM